jgi:hypothetical protein
LAARKCTCDLIATAAATVVDAVFIESGALVARGPYTLVNTCICCAAATWPLSVLADDAVDDGDAADDDDNDADDKENVRFCRS